MLNQREEIRIPLKMRGESVIKICIPVGDGLRRVPFTLETPLNLYASFRFTALDVVIMNEEPNADVMANLVVDFLGVAGGENLLYNAENIVFAGTVSKRGRLIDGLNAYPVLEPSDTVRVEAVFYQQVTNAVEINLSVEFAQRFEQLYRSAVLELLGKSAADG